MTKNKSLLTKLACLGVLKTEPIKTTSSNDSDIIITKNDSKLKVIIEQDMTNEELLLKIEADKLETLQYIKSVVKAYVIGCTITFLIWLFYFLVQWGNSVAGL